MDKNKLRIFYIIYPDHTNKNCKYYSKSTLLEFIKRHPRENKVKYYRKRTKRKTKIIKYYEKN